MINVLSYIGMNMQSEVCLWTLLGLIRTIFDATLFRVNSNLKQVWQMSMPEQLSMPVQRVLRTMISGVMLIQCFTVYVYLASYIVLLYPVFLEDRPALVLPWLLLAAIRKLLCELTSLALGLGTCVLLGPTRPPCIKFVIIKLISIMPSFYTWMLLFSYYHSLKIAAAFKTFPTVLSGSDHDYGLELAIRRRKTKSLLGEDQLRSKIVASLYNEERLSNRDVTALSKIGISSRMIHSTDTSATDIKEFLGNIRPMSAISKQQSDTGSYEDWFGNEIVVPRGTDRILEQFALMMLRIGAYLNREGLQDLSSHILNNKANHNKLPIDNLPCHTIADDTPPQVGSVRSSTASYLREYPQIFMKKTVDVSRPEENCGTITTAQAIHQPDEDGSITRTQKRLNSSTSKESTYMDIEHIENLRKPSPKEFIEYKQSSTSLLLDHKQKIKLCNGREDKINTQQPLTIRQDTFSDLSCCTIKESSFESNLEINNDDNNDDSSKKSKADYHL